MIEIQDMRRPAAGVIVHVGVVVAGYPKVGNRAIAEVDAARRHDIMRNHTATHLMHRALHEVLGEHARQAGSLVAPDRLRFDLNNPEAMTSAQIERVEQIANVCFVFAQGNREFFLVFVITGFQYFLVDLLMVERDLR